MSGPRSWAISIILGLVGAALGWFIFTYLLGIGDEDVFDFGGIIGAIIGTVIVIPIASYSSAGQRAPAADQPHLAWPATPAAWSASSRVS
jgi:uncharacterized membrane protein YeaQ/YmgE (transglycosylase-associated protein family)